MKNQRFWGDQGWIFFFSCLILTSEAKYPKGLSFTSCNSDIFFKSLFIGTQHAESHWRFGNCVCCWSLSVLEVSSLLLPCRRGIFFSYDTCFSPWEGFELTRLLILRNSTALLTSPEGTSAYRQHGLCIVCPQPVEKPPPAHSFLAFVGISASCWETSHCFCMKTKESVFLPKQSSIQMRSDCSHSLMVGPGICNCNASGDNRELIYSNGNEQ